MKQFDVLCILGRGIERVISNGKEVWQPTQYLEQRSKKDEHSGIRTPGISFNSNDPRTVIAGSEINVLAAATLLKKFSEKNQGPQVTPKRALSALQFCKTSAAVSSRV